jgi:hypothetical protein
MQTTPRITASVDKQTVTTELGKTESLVLTINSVDGFTGSVAIASAVLDGTTPVTGWTVTAEPPTVDLVDGASAQVQLSVKIPTDTASLLPALKLDMTSSAPAISAESAFAVTNQLTIDFPAGSGTGSLHAGLPSQSQTIRIRRGAKVIFHNADNISHQVHANGGIQHEGSALAAGSDYVVTPNDNATWYCHLHENPINRPILIVE